jgi:thiol-disulfide isomerase/thioredoxin
MFAALVPFGTSAIAAPQDDPAPAPPERPAPALRPGDPAPPLKATRWLQGDEVRAFETGKVYVVQFWATWCGSCYRNMPELAELQARYKDRGVTVIGFTCRDIRGVAGHGEEKVAAVVKKRGPAFKYTFAYNDDVGAADAWIKGQDYFQTFVVDKSGRIAYIGAPMFLDVALPKVLAGAAPASVGDEMKKIRADYQPLWDTLKRDPTAGLRMLEEFEARYPALTDSLPVVSAKLDALLARGDRGAKEYAEAVVAKAVQRRNLNVLQLVYLTLCDKKESEGLRDLALRSAEAMVRIDGGTDPYTLLKLAEAHFKAGNKPKAEEYANKACDAVAAEPPDDRRDVEKEARRFGARR